MISPRVLFSGDAAAVTPWFGIAKKLARACYASKIVSKFYQLGDVTIRVENIFPTSGPLDGVSKVWIEGGGSVYMESGYIDATGNMDDEAYQVKNSVLETTETEEATTALDNMKFKSVPKCTRNKYRSHAIPGGIHDKRWTFPISACATGLLRRAAQAAIGRANPHYVVPSEGMDMSGQQSPLNVDRIRVLGKLLGGREGVVEFENQYLRTIHNTHSRNHTCGLFGTTDYQYRFIETRPGTDADHIGIDVYLCKEKNVAKKLRKALEGTLSEFTQQEKDQVETYLLSDIEPDFDNGFDLGEFSIIGSPVFNGWHFNRRGTCADIVTFTPVPYEDTDILRHVVSRHYRLTFVETPDYAERVAAGESIAPLTAAIALLEEVACTPGMNVENIWVPLYITVQMAYYYWRPHATIFYDLLESDAPVYGFYDSEDRLTMLRMSYEAFVVALDPYFNDAVMAAATGDGTYMVAEGTTSSEKSLRGFFVTIDGDISQDYRTTENVGKKAIFSSEAALTGQTYTGTGSGWSPIINVSSGAVVPYDPVPYMVPYTTQYNSVASEKCFTSVEYTSVVWVRRPDFLCLIPWWDAESFFIGTYVIEEDNGPEITSYNYGVGREQVTFPNESLFLDVTQKAFASGSVSYPDVPFSPISYGDSSATVNVYHFTVEAGLDLFTRHGRIADIASLQYTTNDIGGWDDGSIDHAIRKWSSLADPVLFGEMAYPYFDTPYVVLQGLGPAAVYNTDPQTATLSENIEQVGLVDTTKFEDVRASGLFSGWA